MVAASDGRLFAPGHQLAQLHAVHLGGRPVKITAMSAIGSSTSEKTASLIRSPSPPRSVRTAPLSSKRRDLFTERGEVTGCQRGNFGAGQLRTGGARQKVETASKSKFSTSTRRRPRSDPACLMVSVIVMVIIS